jgi:hypothetical protein
MSLCLFPAEGLRTLVETAVGKFLIELVDTASRVDKFHFAGKEWVGIAGYLQLHQRVFLAIFPGDVFLGCCAGARQEGIARGEILEYHQSIISRMNLFFHDAVDFLLKNRKGKFFSKESKIFFVALQYLSSPLVILPGDVNNAGWKFKQASSALPRWSCCGRAILFYCCGATRSPAGAVSCPWGAKWAR